MIARVLFAMALCFASGSVLGQAPPPPISSVIIEPAAPAAGQLVSVVVQYTGCDFPRPGAETLTRVGNTIVFSPLLPVVACGVPPPTPPVSYPIGYFAPGNYTLFYAARTDVPFLDYVPISRGFTVGPASIPATGFTSLAALASAMLAVAWLVRRRLRTQRQALPIVR